MYRAGAAVQLLQAIGQQREAAGAGGSSSAAAEAAAAVAVDAAGEPARGAADGQPQQAERQDKAAGKRPLAAGQAAEAAAQQQLQAHQRSGQAQQQGAPNAAAVQLRGILAVGMDSEQARRVRPAAQPACVGVLSACDNTGLPRKHLYKHLYVLLKFILSL